MEKDKLIKTMLNHIKTKMSDNDEVYSPKIHHNWEKRKVFSDNEKFVKFTIISFNLKAGYSIYTYTNEFGETFFPSKNVELLGYTNYGNECYVSIQGVDSPSNLTINIIIAILITSTLIAFIGGLIKLFNN